MNETTCAECGGWIRSGASWVATNHKETCSQAPAPRPQPGNDPAEGDVVIHATPGSRGTDE